MLRIRRSGDDRKENFLKLIKNDPVFKPSNAQEEEIQVTLLRYGHKVLKQIGKGSFGMVFKTRLESASGIYAFKVFNMSVCEASMVEKEVSIQKSLHHPNIVRCVDSFSSESGRFRFLQLEYFEEGNLTDFLWERRHSTDEALLVQIFCQVKDALQYLKEQQIIHLDVKEDNIFVATNGRIAIGDFGLSERGSVFAGINFKGTPSHIAPESSYEYTEHPCWTLKGDMYSFGVTLYKAVFGSYPFQVDNFKNFSKKCLEIPLKMSDEFFEDPKIPVSEECIDLLKNLLHPSPSLRLSTEKFCSHPFFLLDRKSIKRQTSENAENEQFRSYSSHMLKTQELSTGNFEDSNSSQNSNSNIYHPRKGMDEERQFLKFDYSSLSSWSNFFPSQEDNNYHY